MREEHKRNERIQGLNAGASNTTSTNNLNRNIAGFTVPKGK